MLLYGMEYYNNEKEQITATCKHMDEYHKYNVDQNKPGTKDYICVILSI